jgi:uncharacterized membrane protein YhaH (DUF805 family)
MKKYYHSDGKEKYGPFSYEEMKDEKINRETLIWFEGLDNWTPAKYIMELEEILKLIPPPLDNVDSENSFEAKLSFEDTKEVGTTGNIEDIEDPDINEDKESDERRSNSTDQKSRAMFSGLFSFKGRIRRTEYGMSVIIYVFLIYFLDIIIVSVDETVVVFAFLAYIPLTWFILAQGAKRCHDTGVSGWFQLIPFYVLYLIFAKGEDGLRNKYGTNPKL